MRKGVLLMMITGMMTSFPVFAENVGKSMLQSSLNYEEKSSSNRSYEDEPSYFNKSHRSSAYDDSDYLMAQNIFKVDVFSILYDAKPAIYWEHRFVSWFTLQAGFHYSLDKKYSLKERIFNKDAFNDTDGSDVYRPYGFSLAPRIYQKNSFFYSPFIEYNMDNYNDQTVKIMGYGFNYGWGSMYSSYFAMEYSIYAIYSKEITVTETNPGSFSLGIKVCLNFIAN